jgi:CHRD domain
MLNKALHLAVAAGLLLATAGAASAQNVNLTATLSGAEETPAPGINTGAFGFAEVGVDLTNQEVTVALNVFNLPTGSTAGHIHAGGKGTPGPVILDFSFPAGRTGDFELNFRLGRAAFRARPDIGIATFEDALQAIAAGNGYVNVHTTANGGGEIRGQLIRRGQGQNQEQQRQQ